MGFGKRQWNYNAMNKAVNFVTGRFCLFLNSGDYFASNSVLTNVENFMDENIVDFFAGDTLFNHKDSQCFMGVTAPDEFTVPFFFRRSLCHQSTFLIDKERYPKVFNILNTFRRIKLGSLIKDTSRKKHDEIFN